MTQSLSRSSAFRFGIFTLDRASGELRKHGIRIKVQDRPLQILLMLLERPGEVVSREDIRQRLWADGTFVDFDHSISSAMNKLRAALNDSATHPRYVETVGRRGYRFVYPVSETQAAPPENVTLVAYEPVGHTRRTRIAVLLAALLVFGSGAWLWWARSSASPANIRSIAVLPLENLSTDPEQEYFSDGLTDELITRLASLNGLTVISRTSSMQYKDSRKPLPQIAKELGVDAIVAGSVLRSGDRIRITAQLIRASTDRHLWAHSYERAQEDVLELQNDVTRDIADNIELTIDPALRERLEKKGSIDPAAHEAYLRGRYQLSKRRIPDMKQAGAYFEEAIDRDPDYALAYAALANSYALLGAYDPPQEQYIPKARAAALKALSLDGGLSEAHLSLAVIAQNYDMDWTTAEREYLKAIDLDPNNATAHHWYAEFLAFHARFPEAFAQIERAKQLDPFSLILLADRAVILYYARRYDESIAQFEEVIAADPSFPRATLVIGPYIEKHRFRKALAQLDRFDPNGTTASATGARIYVYGRAGDEVTARRLLSQLESRIDPDHMDVTAFVHAHVGVGNNNKAFSDLYQALEQHSTALSSLKVNPLYDPLRSDPRFADLLHKVKLD